MGDLPEAVTMSTSSSGSEDAALDVVAVAATNEHLPLREALRKLPEHGFDPVALPQTEISGLWARIEHDCELSLAKLSALQNKACTARPRGVLRRIDDSTMYRISDQRIRASFTISNVVNLCTCTLKAELLVDPGANTDVKLPARKVMQLGLRPFGRPTQPRGSTNATTYNMHFNPVLVKAVFIRNGLSETIEAYLDVNVTRMSTRLCKPDRREWRLPWGPVPHAAT
jgi:hypothetical protein